MDARLPLTLNGWAWFGWLVYWIVAASDTHRTVKMESRLSRLQHGALMFGGFYMIFHHGNPFFYGRFYQLEWMRWLGDAFTAAGLLFSIWARVHLGKYWSGVITLKEGHKLITTGPYEWVRHPIYTGLITAAIGSAMAAETVDGFVGLVMIIAGCLVKLRREEALLTGQFGDEYAKFQRDVPMLLPIPRPSRP
ncbi:MAG: isoprenylcysteine carboxylmethyltransferase family protein [Tepidisphaeraceae bacterium]